MDSPAALFLTLMVAVVCWFVLRWLIVAVWSYTDNLISAFRKQNEANEQGTLEDDEPKEDSEPIRKEWEEQEISFQEWLDYSDERGQLPPPEHYEQFKSYRPPQPPSRRDSGTVRPKPSSVDSAPRHVIQPSYVAVPTPTPTAPKQSLSPLVRKFLSEGIHLYHFTDSKNLESIKRIGLLSRDQLTATSLSSTYLSNDLSRSLDEQRGLSEYIHLSFHPEHSMLKAAQYRTSGSIVVLAVSLEVLDRPGCCFTRALANANGVVRIPVAEITDSDFRQVRSGSYESRKWQLLVPGLIPWRFLKVQATHERLIPIWQ